MLDVYVQVHTEETTPMALSESALVRPAERAPRRRRHRAATAGAAEAHYHKVGFVVARSVPWSFVSEPTWRAVPPVVEAPAVRPLSRWWRRTARRLGLPQWTARSPVATVRRRVEATSDLNAQALVVEGLICDEPWFTRHTDHDDGMERTDLQLALCELTKFTRHGFTHTQDDGCLEYEEIEERLDQRRSDESARVSTDPKCRAEGHAFAQPWMFRDVCVRCGCVRLLRGNPSRYVYEYPPSAESSRL